MAEIFGPLLVRGGQSASLSTSLVTSDIQFDLSSGEAVSLEKIQFDMLFNEGSDGLAAQALSFGALTAMTHLTLPTDNDAFAYQLGEHSFATAVGDGTNPTYTHVLDFQFPGLIIAQSNITYGRIVDAGTNSPDVSVKIWYRRAQLTDIEFIKLIAQRRTRA